MGSGNGGEWRKDRPSSSIVGLSAQLCRCIEAFPIFYFCVNFLFDAASIFLSLSFAIPGHSDGWDGNGMKRRGKMRLDTNTAPEVGGDRCGHPYSRCLFLGPLGTASLQATQHTICRVSELPARVRIACVRPWVQAGTRGQVWHVRVCVDSPRAIVGRKKPSIEFWPDSIVATYLSIKHLPRADQKEASDEMDHRWSPRSFSVNRFDPVMSVVRQGGPILLSFSLLVFFPFWS